MYEDEDIGESPINDGRFQPGVSGNPAGRPRGSKNGKPRSKMRTTLAKLYEIQGPAIELVRQALTGKDAQGNVCATPDKDKVDMAKWVVTKIESLNNTCLREEMAIQGVRAKSQEDADQLAENQQETGKANETGNFSLDLVATQIKH